MASIRQNAYSELLPDFRNMAVMARVLVAVNVAALTGTLYATPALGPALERFVYAAAFLEPLLLIELMVLYAVSPFFPRFTYWQGAAAIVGLTCVLAAMYHAAVRSVAGGDAMPSIVRTLLLAIVVAASLLAYFRLHSKAFSPALAEARLQALQARIRPHFLFNSLNAVLALIRRDPKRAERTLEDLADLFRTLMADARQFVRLADEVQLLERYAEIEHLRLADRLRVTWQLDAAPLDALLPPMVLQPLLENAIYHGVEPGTGVGDVLVRIERRGERVHAAIENPHLEQGGQRAGNRMALDNIRERLALFFDAEARLETRIANGRYRVEIEIPYRRA
ncbi:MAG TPA: histidine kinase [Burkholderiales bacterium]|jgi:two-component system sensor histidine kinase AlgZ|nr:histidine kinase [Burkholderiales bacterium]